MRPDENGSSPARGAVVVGVDGSAAAGAALRWAAAEARLRNTRLRVVHAWTFNYAAIEGYGYAGESLYALPSGGMSHMHEAAESLVGQAISELGPEADGVEIDREVFEGPAAEVLV